MRLHALPVLRRPGVRRPCVHAECLKMTVQSDKRTDRKDAATIAKMLRLWKRGEIELQMAYIPTREECALKDLCRYREEISKELGDSVRRIKSQMSRNCQLLPPGMDDFQTKRTRRFVMEKYHDDAVLMRRMDQLERDLAERDSVQRQVEACLPGSRDVDLLVSIPGIARQSAVQIMSMIVDVKRFPDAEKMCAYYGLVPRVRDSGGKEHHGRMTKKGDKMMRAIMERATSSHVLTCESNITDCYRRSVPKMGKKKAMVTASRKTLTTAYAVLRSGKEFRARS